MIKFFEFHNQFYLLFPVNVSII